VSLKSVMRCLTGMLWYSFAGVVVLTAVLLTLTRILLPLAENYRVEAEQALSEYAGQPVKVADMQAHWRGFEPQLKFSDVRLYDPEGKKIQFQFAHARMGINLIDSVRKQDFVPSSFTMSGIELSITRQQDSSISVEGLSNGKQQKGRQHSQQFLQWVLRQPNLGIESSRITWSDEVLGDTGLVFSEVNFRLKNQGDYHQIDGDTVLPDAWGKHIQFALDMRGAADDLSAWQGEFYAKGEQLTVSSPLRARLPEASRLTAAKTDVEAWGTWQDGKLKRLEGDVSLTELEFSAKGVEAVPLTSLQSTFSWQYDKNEWRLQLSGLVPGVGDQRWPESEVAIIGDLETQRYVAVAGYVRLADVLPFVYWHRAIDDSIHTRLKGLRPDAELRNVSFLASLNEADPQRWHIEADYSNLTTQADGDWPGFAGLSGKLQADNNGGSLIASSNRASFDMTSLFREVMQFDSLNASLEWQKEAEGWSVRSDAIEVSNPDISLRSQFSLLLPADGSEPFIELFADFKNGVGKRTPKYLPVAIIQQSTIDWLDKSIVQGTSPSGKVVVRGPLAKFPFEKGEGRFEVRFDVVDAVLDYEPGWPVISEMQGEVIFSGKSMHIIGKSGRILGAKVHDVTAHIDDLIIDDMLLEIKGHVEASSDDVLKYLLKTGLTDDYAQKIRRLDPEGRIAMQLAIDIPVLTGDGTVTGKAQFADASLGLQGQAIRLEHLKGEVSISNDGLKGKGLVAELFGSPVSLDVTHGDNDDVSLAMTLAGNIDLNAMLTEHISADIPWISEGAADWQARLFIQKPGETPRPAIFEMSSELLGTELKLPAPFAKPTDENKSLRLQTLLSEKEILQLDVNFGSDASAVVDFRHTDKGLEYVRSTLAFGEAIPITTDSDGLYITGQLDTLSVDNWLAFIKTLTVTDEAAQENKALEWLYGMDVQVNRLDMLGSTFNIKQLAMNREDNYWQGQLDADRARGSMRIPYDYSVTPIKVDLDYLKMDRLQDEISSTSYDPRQWPGLDLKVRQFEFDGAELGELSMMAQRSHAGLFMEHLKIEGPELLFTASGDWQLEAEQQVTRLRAKLKTKDLSDLLAELGYAAGFEAGKSRNKAQLEWQGGPLEFSTGKLNGTISIDIRDGQLLDISPGAGRIFGLLSLQTLPRRLTLDFSDVFKRGFTFDRIKGKFAVEQGDAHTSDLFLEGPSARIEVIGVTDLGGRNYDQLITVTPNVTGSLPLAGALLGGPLAGVSVYALDKVFGGAIGDIASYQYTVTGSWDEPKVEKYVRGKERAATETEAGSQ